MTVEIQAERWCNFLMGGGDRHQSACGEVALAECPVCKFAFCDNHALICPECLAVCCPACDHACTPQPLEIAA